MKAQSVQQIRWRLRVKSIEGDCQIYTAYMYNTPHAIEGTA